MGMARDRDCVAMDVGNAKKQSKTPRTATEWPLVGTPRLPARAYPAAAGVTWPKLHEDGRGPLNLGLPPPHSKKAAAAAQVNEVAEGAYTLKEAMRLTVQSKPWNEAGRPVGKRHYRGGLSRWRLSSARPGLLGRIRLVLGCSTHSTAGPGPCRSSPGAVAPPSAPANA